MVRGSGLSEISKKQRVVTSVVTSAEFDCMGGSCALHAQGVRHLVSPAEGSSAGPVTFDAESNGTE
jgi:hypothetical protein